MPKILVTGVNGFVGKHLVRELNKDGIEVIGLSRDKSPNASIKPFLASYRSCDLTKQQDVNSLDFTNISAVVNLAGLAAVGRSFDEPDLYMDVNVSVFTSIANRIRNSGRTNLRLIAISTGAVYAPGQSLPLTEKSAVTKESSPYAASKLAMEKAALKFRSEGFDCVIARPFNHIGPGQDTGFLLPDLYKKIRSAEGSRIKVGNLETQRDYTDVRDVARAYMALATAQNLRYDTYNVCSGTPLSGHEMLEKLKAACQRSDLRTIVDKTLFRPSDAPVLYGANSRLRAETGWQPTIPLEQTIADFVSASS